MTDIIKDAKQLLGGATPAPWVTGGKDESGNMYIGNPSGDGNLVATSGICDAELIAAAPELAQALAEETYEYAVQAKTGSRWEYKQDGFFRDAWFSELRKAKAGARELRSIGKETRIVRRRVSPVEVINERRCV